MFGAFFKGIGQLGDKPTRRLLWISIGMAIAVFLVLWFAIGFLITTTTLFELSWLEDLTDLGAGIATLVLTWLLFPAVVSAGIGFLLDRVADCVEAKHYPDLPRARDVGIGEVLLTTVKFLAVLVALNLVTMVFLLFPPVFPFVFYAVNGYLLSREYFELVACRRLDPGDALKLRRDHGGTLFITGIVIAFLLTIPVVNLLAPIIATAAMVHLFEGWRSRA